MRPDRAIRLVFSAASAVGRATGTQPDAVGAALQQITATVESACQRTWQRSEPAAYRLALLQAGHSMPPRLVAVSKGQTVDLVQEAYSYGIRHFGENYVQELQSKARELKSLMGSMMDIRWHFIGRLQKKNTKKLVEVPGLWMVETVDSYRSAKVLNQRWGDRREKSFSGSNSPLHVMLQVNTSREESKQGCCPEMCVDLGHYVEEECPHLNLCGLMTIGRQCQTVTPNPDFMKLLQCRERLRQQVKCVDLELSMGMTDDYEHAVELGSTNIRIGRAIFSPRI